MTDTIISSATVKRLISDIKEITLNPLTKDGIYYKHDESNMLCGYALIIGPNETPYQYGNFLFKFIFPYNYPYAPPHVTYHTNDGVTRFNPNSLGNSPNKYLDYHYHFPNQLLLFIFNYLSPSLHELPPHSPHLPHREA